MAWRMTKKILLLCLSNCFIVTLIQAIIFTVAPSSVSRVRISRSPYTTSYSSVLQLSHKLNLLDLVLKQIARIVGHQVANAVSKRDRSFQLTFYWSSYKAEVRVERPDGEALLGDVNCRLETFLMPENYVSILNNLINW